MGNNLPEILYRAWVNGAGLSYGSDETPGWHNLRSEQRYAWEQVAAKARRAVLDRAIAEIATIEEEHGCSVAFDELRERFGR